MLLNAQMLMWSLRIVLAGLSAHGRALCVGDSVSPAHKLQQPATQERHEDLSDNNDRDRLILAFL